MTVAFLAFPPRQPDPLVSSSEMDRDRRSGSQQSVLILALLVLVGAWPLFSLASRTTTRTWALSGVAASLGAILAFWLWDRRMRLPWSRSGAWRPWMWIAAAVAPAAAIGSTPPGVRMIYSASLEGIVLAIAVVVLRTHSNDRHAPPDD